MAVQRARVAFAIAAIGLLACSGCALVTGTYFRPSAAVGRISSYAAGIHCGPPDTLKLDRNGVGVWITAYFLTSNLPTAYRDLLSVELRVPEFRVVTLRPAGFVIRSRSGKRISANVTVKAVVAPASSTDVPSVNGEVHLIGRAHELNRHHYSEYTIQIPFSKNGDERQIPQQFTLAVPRMDVSGEKFNRLIIRFTKEKATWTAGLQCL